MMRTMILEEYRGKVVRNIKSLKRDFVAKVEISLRLSPSQWEFEGCTYR